MTISAYSSGRPSQPLIRRITVTATATACALLLASTLDAQGAGDPADASRVDALVDRYVTAMRDFDLEAMSAMWTEDVVFSDPTAGSRIEGRAVAKSRLSASLGTVADLRLEIHTRFVSNGHAVLIYDGSATMIGAVAGKDVPVQTTGILVLRLEGDRIAEHVDYIDYDSMKRQMAAAATETGGS